MLQIIYARKADLRLEDLTVYPDVVKRRAYQLPKNSAVASAL